MAQRTGPKTQDAMLAPRGLVLAIALGVVALMGERIRAAPPSFDAPDLLHPAISIEPRPIGDRAPPVNHSRQDHRDEVVMPATYQTSASGTAPANSRAPAHPLDPMPIAGAQDKGGQDKGGSRIAHRDAPASPSALPALLSMFGSLAVVLGLFFGVLWIMRRGMPKGTRALPGEVVESLGRAPLAGRQQMHLIRFGQKLLLVSLSPSGAETLSEITDPAEVDRLAGLCQQTHSQSATGAFRQVLKQFGQDRSFSWPKANRSAASAVEDSHV